MGKIRVYELARELNIESKALLAKMKDAGIIVNSHQSTLTSAQIVKIRALCEEKQERVVVRRRKKVEEVAEPTSGAAVQEVQASAEEASQETVLDKPKTVVRRREPIA